MLAAFCLALIQFKKRTSIRSCVGRGQVDSGRKFAIAIFLALFFASECCQTEVGLGSHQEDALGVKSFTKANPSERRCHKSGVGRILMLLP